jgi:UDP-glucose 4-epimerase
MNVLVTGGAGYIGSIVAEKLLHGGHSAIILDNLQQGHRKAVLPEAEFLMADIRDVLTLEKAFNSCDIDAVMHLAAEVLVDVSMTDPGRYFHSNVVGGINLIDIMLKQSVDKLIFSSTASIYGEPQSTPIGEDHPKAPINSYGESKLMFEHILRWYGQAYGLKHVSLRYFNAAGASELHGEDHHPETHLIPNVLEAALHRESAVSIFGTDYPTKDGSCIRDYIHVIDIASAHILALERIEKLSGSSFNLGNGEGFSVLEVVNAAKEITGIDIPVEFAPRRSGDPAVLVARSNLALAELGWIPKYTGLDSIIGSAWEWMKKHPGGYDD